MSFLAPVLQGVGIIKAGKDANQETQLSAADKESAARDEINTAALEEASLRTDSRKFLGRQRAAQAQSGVEGATPDAVSRQSAIDAELDALNLRYAGKLRANALLKGAQSDRLAGRNRERNAKLQGASAILQGYANYAGAGLG